MPDDTGARPVAELPPVAPPHRVRWPVNIHSWDAISFLHWRFEPDQVQRLLPQGLTVLTFDGAAWVGVTPFFIRVRPLGVPFVPPRCAFPETNVRTYVTGGDGRQGIWFLHMEVPALWFVAALRALGLPYVRRDMAVERSAGALRYWSRPRRAGHGGHDIVIRPDRTLVPPHGGDLERFLTARWGAFHSRGPVLLHTQVEHPSWELSTAVVERCEVGDLFRSVPLPVPVDAPVAHHSAGVEVRVGPPTLARWHRG